MMLEEFSFYLFAGLGVSAAGFLLIEGRTPLSASIAWGFLGLAVAGVLQALGADFLAIAQWTLSLGSVLILFIASLMVSDSVEERFGQASMARVFAKLLGVVAAVLCAGLLFGVIPQSDPGQVQPAAMPGAAEVGRSLFGGGASPVHILGLLLLAVLVGSIVLAKRRLD